MNAVRVGLDLAKSVFQVHGVDAAGQAVVRRRLTRSQLLPFFAKLPACIIGMEACSSAHHWARELTRLGHEVRLIPPQDVKPYVKRNKTDAADAEAICEADDRTCGSSNQDAGATSRIGAASHPLLLVEPLACRARKTKHHNVAGLILGTSK